MKPILRFRATKGMFAAVVAIVAVILVYAAPASAHDGRRLTLGRITEEPDRNISKLNTMATYLARVMAPDGIEGVDVAIAETPEKMAGMLRRGEVDLFSETPFTALALMDAGLAEPLLREWKEGVAEYHAVIFVRADAGIRLLDDLLGRKIAFEDPGSTSGYLLPRAALGAAGLPLKKLDNPRDAAPADGVGYSFANGEINVVAWVNRGLADAGAVSNLDWTDPEKAPERLKNGLTIIHETPPVVRSLMMVRPSLDLAVKQHLASVLSRMHERDDGRAALKAYFKVSQYDALDDRVAANLENVRQMWRQAGMKDE